MAYMDFSGFAETKADRRADFSRSTVGRLEIAAVDVGLVDGLDSLDEPGRLRRILTVVFGLRPTHVLADPRLEAIRKLTVAARLGSADQLRMMIARAKSIGMGPDVVKYVLGRFVRHDVVA